MSEEIKVEKELILRGDRVLIEVTVTHKENAIQVNPGEDETSSIDIAIIGFSSDLTKETIGNMQLGDEVHLHPHFVADMVKVTEDNAEKKVLQKVISILDIIAVSRVKGLEI